MNPLFRVNDTRPVVWTVSETNPNLYCLYINSQLTHENLPFNQFYPLLKDMVAKYS